ncbi:hypothetical protein ACRAWD_27485 [Caulobacter segnis]
MGAARSWSRWPHRHAVAASTRFSTATSTVGEILDEPVAKAVVDRRLPTVFAVPPDPYGPPADAEGSAAASPRTASPTALWPRSTRISPPLPAKKWSGRQPSAPSGTSRARPTA